MNNTEFEKYNKVISTHLLDFLPEIDKKSATLLESMQYSLEAGGKHIRPILLLATCDLLGGDISQALPYACAIEYIHTYSLIHDDLPAMDDDDLRRGKPTNHKVYGEAMAILAGDGLLSSAFEAITKDMLLYLDKPAELKKRIQASSVIAKGCGCRGMIGGQVADIEAEGKIISSELLDYIHVNKTASLIESAISAGAYLGAANADQRNNLSIYGENIGLAFQIVDDILDATGDADTIGKNAGQDVLLGKATFPALHGIDKSIERLKELTNKAIKALEPFGDKALFLADIANYLAERTK